MPISACVKVLTIDPMGGRGGRLGPSDLAKHRCIGWRPAPRTAPYRWEFGEDGREFDVAANPEITTNDMWLMIRTACAGGGITFGMEEHRASESRTLHSTPPPNVAD